jgi:glycosyltransferase involved in cell wall biosynthesis
MSLGRILFVSAELDNGGSERHSAILLPALRDRGFQVTVVTLSGEGRAFHELRARGIDIHCAGMRRRTDISGLKRALSLVRVMPDLIVSQSLSAQIFAEVLAERTRRPHLTIEHTSPGFPLRGHQRALLRLCAPRIHSVVAVARAQLPRLIGLGYRRERIRVIPNGVPQVRPTRARDVTRAEFKLKDGDFVALHVGNLRPLKRPDLFLSSVVAANQVNPVIRGLIVGDGTDRARISELAAATEGAVRFLGTRSDVPDIMHAADVVCLTSVTESMPMTILEAMSQCRAVISTDVGGIPEVVTAGETGILMRPEDCRQRLTSALLELAADPVLARRLGSAGRQRYDEAFSADRMIDRYARTLRELGDSRRPLGAAPAPASPSRLRSQIP